MIPLLRRKAELLQLSRLIWAGRSCHAPLLRVRSCWLSRCDRECQRVAIDADQIPIGKTHNRHWLDSAVVAGACWSRPGIQIWKASVMIGAPQCREASAECMTRGSGADISVQRATILLAMSRNWLALANQMDRLKDVEDQECRSPPAGQSLWTRPP